MEYLKTHVLQYYGFDWIAMVATFTSLYLLGNQNRYGFMVGMIGTCGWFAYGILSDSIANMIANIVIIGLQIRGFKNWTNQVNPKPV